MEAFKLTGIINCEVASFVNGSLGVNVVVNAEATFSGDQTMIENTLNQAATTNEMHLWADDTDLLLSEQPIVTTGQYLGHISPDVV